MPAYRYAAAFLGALAIAAAATGGAWAQALPDAPGKADVMEVCTQCHDVGVVAQKPRTPDEWTSTVLRMQGMGANMDDAKRASILAYLNANFGTGPAAPAATPAPAAPAAAPPTPATPQAPQTPATPPPPQK